MKSSEFLQMFAEVNRKAGYENYANMLEERAVVFEAKEILEEKDDS